MDKIDEDIAIGLDKLCEREKRSAAKRVREALPKIEAALDAGNTHTEIFEVLKAAGLKVAFHSYKDAFYRARKKLQGADKSAPPERQADALPLKTEITPSKPLFPAKDRKGFAFEPFDQKDQEKLTGVKRRQAEPEKQADALPLKTETTSSEPRFPAKDRKGFAFEPFQRGDEHKLI